MSKTYAHRYVMRFLTPKAIVEREREVPASMCAAEWPDVVLLTLEDERTIAYVLDILPESVTSEEGADGVTLVTHAQRYFPVTHAHVEVTP